MNNKLLIFDFDGTLVDSLPLWQKVDVIFFDERRNIHYSNDIIDFRPMSIEEAAVATKEVFKIEDSIEDIIQEWADIVNGLYITEDILREGAKELIQEAKSKGYKVAIGTNNTYQLIESYLKKEKMEDWFDYILTADQIKRSKPAPDVFLQIADKLNTPASECIVVEDTLAGVQAGKAANMYTYAIEEQESLPDKDEIQKIANKYIKSLTEITLP